MGAGRLKPAESAPCCLRLLEGRAGYGTGLTSPLPVPASPVTSLHSSDCPPTLTSFPLKPVPLFNWAGHRGAGGPGRALSVIWLLLPGPGP